jgi:hypothetical protein
VKPGGIVTDEERCQHDMLVGQCADCRPSPDGVLASGYFTTTGEVFHNDPKCDMMLDGQRRFLGRGTELPEPKQIRWVDAQARGLGACLGCCTPQWIRRHGREKVPLSEIESPAGSKPCYVLVDGQWRVAQMVWLRKSESGTWWAEITYLANGQQVIVTKSQHHVRPR